MFRDRARSLRTNMTDAERHLWQRLRRKQLQGHRFRRLAPLGACIADFVCYDARLVIEIDGSQHMDQLARDLERDRWFESQSFRVLRFWNNQVLRETDAVIEVIMRALDAPPPHPSPARGEGELVRGDDMGHPPHPSPARGEGELVRGDDMGHPPQPSPARGEGELVRGDDMGHPPHPYSVKGEGESIRSDGKRYPSHPFPVKGEGELVRGHKKGDRFTMRERGARVTSTAPARADNTDMSNAVPPPLAGGGEGEG